MTLGLKIVTVLNDLRLYGILRTLIWIQYRRQTAGIEYVRYHSDFNAWEFRIDGTSYLSSGPGWEYNRSYLTDLLRRLSGHEYWPVEGDTVLDVGAGVGEETIILSSLVGEKGRVFSIEAHPKTFRALDYLCAVNRLNNVTHEALALSREKGFVTIEDSDNSLANSILDVSKDRSMKVACETMDDFVVRHSITRIDLVKMNVEGAEQLIVQGMSACLPIIRHVAISCHDFRFLQGESAFFQTKKIVTDFLVKNNFQVTTQQSADHMVDDYVYGTNLMYRGN